MTTKELRQENDGELNLKLEGLKKEIFELRGQQLDSKSQKTHQIGQKRKEIARILTILKERELRKQ